MIVARLHARTMGQTRPPFMPNCTGQGRRGGGGGYRGGPSQRLRATTAVSEEK